jgi:hypothetical protein
VNHEGILYQGLAKTIDFMLGDPPVTNGSVSDPDTPRHVPHPDLSTANDDVLAPREVCSCVGFFVNMVSL